jgi:predicted nucleic-acid-binding Zn-ribbon protein
MDYESKEVITIRDFNCDWNNLTERTISSQTKRIVDLAQTFQYEQLIKESTRITETSSTLIDLAFSNKPELIIDSGVEHIGISDHSMIYVCRKVSIPRKEKKIFNTRQYKYFEINNFRSDFNEIFQIQSNLTNPNILWEEWKSKFLAVADLYSICHLLNSHKFLHIYCL